MSQPPVIPSPDPTRPTRWVIFDQSAWDTAPPGPSHRFAANLVRRGDTVAFVGPAASPWRILMTENDLLPLGRRARRKFLGQWRHERLFTLRPRTWLPIRRAFWLDNNATWNGSELFSRPRTGALLREAGFARTDVLILRNPEMPHLVRQLQPRLLVLWMPKCCDCGARLPKVVKRRRAELILDADLVVVESSDSASCARQVRAERIHPFKDIQTLRREVFALLSERGARP
ncbi:hypothetical protein KQI84_14050 [bacterium]|nr:hypothetical protein [bacterium]